MHVPPYQLRQKLEIHQALTWPPPDASGPPPCEIPPHTHTHTHTDVKAHFYAQLSRRCVRVHPLRNNRGVKTSMSVSKQTLQQSPRKLKKKKKREREREQKAPRLSECQMRGAGGGGPPGGGQRRAVSTELGMVIGRHTHTGEPAGDTRGTRRA